MRRTPQRRRWLVLPAVIALMLLPAPASAAPSPAGSVAGYSALNAAHRTSLLAIARDTWKFYATDVDPTTHLPLDNVTFAGGSATPTGYGRYTSASNIGVYLWAVVAAKDLGLITSAQANDLINATLTEVTQLRRFDGFLFQWYHTTIGVGIRNQLDQLRRRLVGRRLDSGHRGRSNVLRAVNTIATEIGLDADRDDELADATSAS